MYPWQQRGPIFVRNIISKVCLRSCLHDASLMGHQSFLVPLCIFKLSTSSLLWTASFVCVWSRHRRVRHPSAIVVPRAGNAARSLDGILSGDVFKIISQCNYQHYFILFAPLKQSLTFLLTLLKSASYFLLCKWKDYNWKPEQRLRNDEWQSHTEVGDNK